MSFFSLSVTVSWYIYHITLHPCFCLSIFHGHHTIVSMYHYLLVGNREVVHSPITLSPCLGLWICRDGYERTWTSNINRLTRMRRTFIFLGHPLAVTSSCDFDSASGCSKKIKVLRSRGNVSIFVNWGVVHLPHNFISMFVSFNMSWTT